MKKNKNPWMISTIVISVVSVIAISILSYQLFKTSSTVGNFPNGEGPGQGQMPTGEMPTGGGPGQQEEDTETDGTAASESTNI